MQPVQNRSQNSFPVFKSDSLKGLPNSITLWANMEATGPHVNGKLVKMTPTGEQYTINIVGWFKINEKGGVQIQLSSRQNEQFISEGVLYVQHNGELKFYPKDKTNPQLVVRATNAMSQEVADAIGVKRIGPLQNYEQQNDQKFSNQGTTILRLG